MEKQQLLDKFQELLSNLETAKIITFLKELTVQTVVGNPWILGLLVAVFFFAVIKRSKFVLLFLFTLLSLIGLVQYSLPMGGAEMTVASLLPFAFGCIAICGVLIYFIFIKAE